MEKNHEKIAENSYREGITKMILILLDAHITKQNFKMSKYRIQLKNTVLYSIGKSYLGGLPDRQSILLKSIAIVFAILG